MFFLSDMLNKKLHLPKKGEALPGRARPAATAKSHFVSKRPLKGPYPKGTESVLFGMGSFWCVERLFWRQAGVWVTAAGYAGGETPNPTYQEIGTGLTGHAEVVLVVHDPAALCFADLLRLFWEGHDPTQGMRQGNNVGTPYRSAIYTTTEAQLGAARAAREVYAAALGKAGRGAITTEVAPAGAFYFAEATHQQYLARNPGAPCELRGTGVAFPAVAAPQA